MPTQNTFVGVVQLISREHSRTAQAGVNKLELTLQSERSTRDESLPPLRFRALMYANLAETCGEIPIGSWCIASGRLETGRFGKSYGMVLILRDLAPITVESEIPAVVDTGTF